MPAMLVEIPESDNAGGREGKHTLWINRTVVKIYVETGVESLNITPLDKEQQRGSDNLWYFLACPFGEWE